MLIYRRRKSKQYKILLLLQVLSLSLSLSLLSECEGWNHLEGGWIGDGYMKYDNNAELKILLNKFLKLKD